MNVAFISAVVGSFGLGSSAIVFTGMRAPEPLSTLSPKPLSA